MTALHSMPIWHRPLDDLLDFIVSCTARDGYYTFSAPERRRLMPLVSNGMFYWLLSDRIGEQDSKIQPDVVNNMVQDIRASIARKVALKLK